MWEATSTQLAMVQQQLYADRSIHYKHKEQK